jgi:ABC-type glycerol-3-phosphate transport system permease component
MESCLLERNLLQPCFLFGLYLCLEFLLPCFVFFLLSVPVGEHLRQVEVMTSFRFAATTTAAIVAFTRSQSSLLEICKHLISSVCIVVVGVICSCSRHDVVFI